MMAFEKKDGLLLGTFGNVFSAHGIQAWFSTREGGVSAGVFASLNVGLSTEDVPDRVEENRRRLFRAAGVDARRVAIQRQTHSDHVAYVKAPGMYSDTDACYTDQEGLFLTVTVADCVPILFGSMSGNLAGVIHAGWRGTEKQIARRAINAVVATCDVHPSDIVAMIGPSISAACYEVSDDVALQFEDRFVIRQAGRKPHLDLWAANAEQLRQAGVAEIHVAGYCTAQNQELFFSHRASGGTCGRMLGIIGIEKA